MIRPPGFTQSIRNAQLFALLAFAVLLAGCGSPLLKSVRSDPSFTYANLQDGSLGIGGVVHATDEDASAHQKLWAEQFATAIASKRYPLKVVPHGALATRAGDPLLARAQAEYAEGGLTHETLSLLRAQLRDVRYLLFGRIEADDMSVRYYDQPSPTENEEEEDTDWLSDSTAWPFLNQQAAPKRNRQKHRSKQSRDHDNRMNSAATGLAVFFTILGSGGGSDRDEDANVTRVAVPARSVSIDFDVYDLKQKGSVWSATGLLRRDGRNVMPDGGGSMTPSSPLGAGVSPVSVDRDAMMSRIFEAVAYQLP